MSTKVMCDGEERRDGQVGMSVTTVGESDGEQKVERVTARRVAVKSG